jgi:hypothetical protein
MLAPWLKYLERGALLASLMLLCFPNQTHGADSAVAVVISVSGNAQLLAPTGGKKAVQLFDWLQAGSVIEVGPASSISLAYANGSRYALAEGTKATIASGGPEASAGTVSSLESVPALPRMAALANATGTRPAASRIRGGHDQVRNLYPFADCTALPEDTVLRFTAVEDATRYRIELEDDTGRIVLDAETQSSALAVPAGILRPGARYHWRVTTVERMGPAVRADSEFSTLPEEDIRRRRALRVALLKKGDLESLALVAEIDRRLGLLLEAREEFQEALTKAPGNQILIQTIADIEKQLAPESEKH